MQIELGTVIVGGVVQTGIGTLFWLAVRKTVEKVDELQKQLEELKDRRVAGLEQTMREAAVETNKRFEAASDGRRRLHEGIEAVRLDYMPRQQCREAMEQFAGAVQDLARVEERVQGMVRTVQSLAEQQVGLGQDLARIQGSNKR